MGFFSRLQARVHQVDSLLCVGLDPHLPDLPEPTPEAAHSFCLRLIEATADLAAAFKPNAAFFEVFGAKGWYVLEKVIAAIPDEIPVILDAKRGDIASTAQAYARAVFETLGAGAVTLNPYLGYDAVAPFLSDPDRGVFLLCKTSNPGAGDFQDLPVVAARRTEDPHRESGSLVGEAWEQEEESLMLYEAVAVKAVAWNRRDNLGLVVGATHPDALERVRRLAPELWILAPGVGFQGGDLGAALRSGLRADGLGMLVPVSRGISQAGDARKAADAMRIAINTERERFLSTAPKRSLTALPGGVTGGGKALAHGLLESGCVQFGEFTLKSGLVSPIYIDLRRLVGDPDLLATVASAYLPLLHGLAFDRLAALPYAALPIATAISLQGGWPMVYPRKESKVYGTQAQVEGIYQPGETVVVVDDLATTGGSKFEAIEKLASAGLKVTDIVVLIDRESGAREALAESGYRLHSVMTLSQLLDEWEGTGLVPETRITAARSFLASSGKPG
jgi:uridine monophosphate synthetase